MVFQFPASFLDDLVDGRDGDPVFRADGSARFTGRDPGADAIDLWPSQFSSRMVFAAFEDGLGPTLFSGFLQPREVLVPIDRVFPSDLGANASNGLDLGSASDLFLLETYLSGRLWNGTPLFVLQSRCGLLADPA